MTDESLNEIIDLSDDGEVTLKMVTDEAWLGSHQISFVVYFPELDPEAAYATTLELAIEYIIYKVEAEEELIEEEEEETETEQEQEEDEISPISIQTIEPVYNVPYGSKTSIYFEFANPSALD